MELTNFDLLIMSCVCLIILILGALHYLIRVGETYEDFKRKERKEVKRKFKPEDYPNKG